MLCTRNELFVYKDPLMQDRANEILVRQADNCNAHIDKTIYSKNYCKKNSLFL